MNPAPHAQDPLDALAGLDLQSPGAIRNIFEEGARANCEAACRRGSVDVINALGSILATGDLHDNPAHFVRVLELARLQDATDDAPRHLTLHEVIHGGSLMSGVDLSHRALARVAALKSLYPETVHTLLANHELSQIVGMGVVKDGVRMKEAFIHGCEYVFGDEAQGVLDSIETFIRSMPLALLSGRGTDRAVLFAHSLPDPALMDRFDPAVLDRDLTDDDYTPRQGSAHIMVWGRRHTPEQLERLAEIWGVRLFVLGHEHAEQGWMPVPPNAVVLNSDHERGVALEFDLAEPPQPPVEPGSRGWDFLPL